MQWKTNNANVRGSSTDETHEAFFRCEMRDDPFDCLVLHEATNNDEFRSHVRQPPHSFALGKTRRTVSKLIYHISYWFIYFLVYRTCREADDRTQQQINRVTAIPIGWILILVFVIHRRWFIDLLVVLIDRFYVCIFDNPLMPNDCI